MGRRAKPTHLKIIENARDRRPAALRAGEPTPAMAIFVVPEWLTEPQRVIWDYALASMPYGLLRAMDFDLFVSWVITVDLRNQAAQKLAASPLLIKGPNGSITPSPYLRMFNQETASLKALAAEFGFSPAARTAIAIEEEYEADPADRFFGPLRR